MGVGRIEIRFGHSLDPHWSGWLGPISPTFQLSHCTLVLTQAEMSGIQVSDFVSAERSMRREEIERGQQQTGFCGPGLLDCRMDEDVKEVKER